MGAARVRMPESAKRGEIIEIRTMVQHPMESGFRLDNTGQPIARHIVNSFRCGYNGQEIIRTRIHPGISVNPFITFFVRVTESGDFVFRWEDDQGGIATHTAHLTVEG